MRTLFLFVFIAGCGANSEMGATPSTTDITASVAPTVSFTDPDDGEMGVFINRKIVATFSTDIDPSIVTETSFTLTQGTTPVPGAVTYAAADRTATFTPAGDFLRSTVYTATIKIGDTPVTIDTGPTDMGDNAQTVNPETSMAKVGDVLVVKKIWTYTTGDL